MAEYIIRLTDEEEETARLFGREGIDAFDTRNVDQLVALTVSMRSQVIAALKLYDELVAAAQEASDV